MVRDYKPKTNKFKLDVAGFEAYFGLRVTGPEEPGSGAFPLESRPCTTRFRAFRRALRALVDWLSEGVAVQVSVAGMSLQRMWMPCFPVRRRRLQSLPRLHRLVCVCDLVALNHELLLRRAS